MSGEHQDKPTPVAATEANSEGAEENALEAAMAEAVAAVDKSEKSSPEEALTESLLSARKELEEALEQTRKEAGNLRDQWMRTAADLENYRKRAAKEKDDIAKYGIEKLLKDFLPIFDDLERASTAHGAGSSEQLLGGVRLVQKKFLSTLEKHGVTSFDAKGEAFNPERHEAVQQIRSPTPEGAVAEELQRGFLIHDRLLRPALVAVSLGPEDSEQPGEGSE